MEINASSEYRTNSCLFLLFDDGFYEFLGK